MSRAGKYSETPALFICAPKLATVAVQIRFIGSDWERLISTAYPSGSTRLPRSGGPLSIAALSERDKKESNGELRSVVLNHLTEDSRDVLLDVGGGTGMLTETLSDVFGQVLVLEPDLGKLEYGARRRPDVGFIRGIAHRIPIADGGVGALISVAAFHHFPDQDAALEEMGRVLKPQGKLLLAEIDISSVRGRLLRFTENRLMGAGSKFLTSAQLLDKVGRHGFVEPVLDRISRGYIVVATRDTAGDAPL
jgi:SAM-dependent methyltransferase